MRSKKNPIENIKIEKSKKETVSVLLVMSKPLYKRSLGTYFKLVIFTYYSV